MWIVPPSIRSAFSRESGCLTKDCTPDLDLWASEAERSCTLNGKPTRSQSWKQGCKKAPYLMRLSGLAICANLTQSSFQAWWIASLRASRAKTSALQADALGSMASAAGCFLKSPALPTIAVRDTSFWRTSQASLLPPPPLWTKPKALLTNVQPPASWANWPTSGGMRNGSLFQRPAWVPAMGGSGGFAGRGEMWKTAKASDSDHGGPNMRDSSGAMMIPSQAAHWPTPNAMDCNMTNQPRTDGRQIQLTNAAGSWATPQARDHRSPDHPESGNYQRKQEQGYTIDLNSQASAWSKWPTPSATVMNDGEPPETWHARAQMLKLKHTNGNGAGLPLTVAAVQWPTPSQFLNEGTSDQYKARKGRTQATVNAITDLSIVAKEWPTPAARDAKGENSLEHCTVTGGGRKHMDQLSNFVSHSSHQAQPTQPGQESSSTGPTSPRRLNPAFTEWLMGWPTGWTIAAPSASSAAATVLWRCKLHLHLSALCAE